MSSFYGSDISLRAVHASRGNILDAGMDRYIRIRHLPFEEVKPLNNTGMIITNPPYGERMGTEDINAVYSSIGDILKKRFTGFTAWILSGDLQALKHVGLKPSRKIILFNGPLECRFAKFGLYEGSQKKTGEAGTSRESS